MLRSASMQSQLSSVIQVDTNQNGYHYLVYNSLLALKNQNYEKLSMNITKARNTLLSNLGVVGLESFKCYIQCWLNYGN
eukprot:UN12113